LFEIGDKSEDWIVDYSKITLVVALQGHGRKDEIGVHAEF
jgi:hypothetical protein